MLDQYILQESMYFENAIIGGLLGVDIVNNTYSFVVDDAINPRVLVAKMAISADKINNVSFEKTIKHNAAFEASSKSIDKKGFWVAMESPLLVDGEELSFTPKSSPIRVTYFDLNSKKATKQFVYLLDHISKPSKGNININGVTAILEYRKNRFFVVERAYQNNYGSYGNTVKIFEAFIDAKTTDVLQTSALKESIFVPLKKRLLLNFDTIKDSLTEGIIVTIEGITFGLILSNGNRTLLLVFDDNFQTFGKQLNQLILLAIQNK